MRMVIQRVAQASVTIGQQVKSSIQAGLLILLGIGKEDTEEDANWLVNKVIGLRIFNDEQGIMNRSIMDIKGEILVVSQFTLMAETKKGNRPSYIRAARPEIAEPLYNEVVQALELRLGHKVGTGRFGADMQVSLVNDGPVTIWLDSKLRE